jgi:hypothetical protein
MPVESLIQIVREDVMASIPYLVCTAIPLVGVRLLDLITRRRTSSRAGRIEIKILGKMSQFYKENDAVLEINNKRTCLVVRAICVGFFHHEL